MSLRPKLTLLLLALVIVVAGSSAGAAHLLNNVWLAWWVVVGASLLPVVWLAARATRPLAQMLRALASTVASYREGDFSLSLVAVAMSLAS
jgi:two-component system, NtrC family, nitrogen regulation sensor histidine kinase NtrY